MAAEVLSLYVSGFAVLLSLASFGYTWRVDHGRRRYERAVACGDVFVNAQRLKNELSHAIDAAKAAHECFGTPRTSHEAAQLQVLRESIPALESEYQIIWKLVGALETATRAFAAGANPPFDAASLAAKIAVINQRRVLLEYDVSYSKSVAALRSD